MQLQQLLKCTFAYTKKNLFNEILVIVEYTQCIIVLARTEKHKNKYKAKFIYHLRMYF